MVGGKTNIFWILKNVRPSSPCGSAFTNTTSIFLKIFFLSFFFFLGGSGGKRWKERGSHRAKETAEGFHFFIAVVHLLFGLEFIFYFILHFRFTFLYCHYLIYKILCLDGGKKRGDVGERERESKPFFPKNVNSYCFLKQDWNNWMKNANILRTGIISAWIIISLQIVFSFYIFNLFLFIFYIFLFIKKRLV